MKQKLKLKVQNSCSFSTGGLDSLMALSPKTQTRGTTIGKKPLVVVGEIEDELSMNSSVLARDLSKYDEKHEKRSETQVAFAVKSPVTYNRNYMKTELKVHK